jgi:hypothetical protein
VAERGTLASLNRPVVGDDFPPARRPRSRSRSSPGLGWTVGSPIAGSDTISEVGFTGAQDCRRVSDHRLCQAEGWRAEMSAVVAWLMSLDGTVALSDSTSSAPLIVRRTLGEGRLVRWLQRWRATVSPDMRGLADRCEWTSGEVLRRVILVAA